MESSELYHIKQQFVIGAYNTLVDLTLPEPSSVDYTPTLLYKARSCIALDDPSTALSLLPADSEDVSVKAVAALARYCVAAASAGDGGGSDAAAEVEAALEELRDLCVEIEGEDEGVVGERERGLVRVLAGTAFVGAKEIEEALETLGAGSDNENLEAVALIVQIYLSINRPDLAKKEFDRCKRWAEDDLLLQLIESTIGLVTGKDAYADSNAFYTEQLGNPTLSSPYLLTARGITRLLKGDVVAAKSDFEESMTHQVRSVGAQDADTIAACCVAAGLKPAKKGEADEWWSRLTTQYPRHPLVVDVVSKAELFDQLSSRFELPSLPVVSA